MMKRQWIVNLFTLALLAGTVGFNLTAPRSQKADAQEAPAPPPEPPVEVVYSAFFHMVVDLQQQAAELESEGQKGNSLQAYVQTQVSLSDEEARQLSGIAAACVDEIARQDAKALVVIQTFRSQFPGGKIPAGVKLPPPPPELKILQQERNQIILDARSKLVTALGETGFSKIAQFVEKRIAPGVQPVPLDKR
ncbi:MAG: hypothetical protein V7641_4720 [Blastocatellia bacterium]